MTATEYARKARILLWILVVVCVWRQPGAVATAAESKESISGQVSWALNYATGDARGLADEDGYTSGRLRLEQHIAVSGDIDAGAGLSVSAKLDNLSLGSPPKINVDLTTGWGKLRIGDLTVGSGNSLVMNDLALKGLCSNFSWGPLDLEVAVGRAEGLPAYREFRGGEGSAVVEYSKASSSYTPVGGHEAHRAAINGLVGFQLEGEGYEAEFYGAWLRWRDGPTGESLVEFLKGYGLDCLMQGPDPVLVPGQLLEVKSYEFAVQPTDASEYMLLRLPPTSILRRMLTSLIDEYNLRRHPCGNLRYPFVLGSKEEGTFLATLQLHYLDIGLSLDGEVGDVLLDCAVAQGQDMLFYDLGNRRIIANSLNVQLRIDGVWGRALDWCLYEEAGLIQVSFPEEFDQDQDVLRVSYRFKTSTTTFSLGLGVLEDSEVVTLNKEHIKRDHDYIIDYETGLLILLKEIGADDVLEVHYQYYPGGLARGPGSARNVYTLSGQYKPQLPIEPVRFDVAVLEELSVPADQKDSTPMLPRRQMVAGLETGVRIGIVELKTRVAQSLDQNPPYGNTRPNQANQVHRVFIDQLEPEALIVFLGHSAGLTVTQRDSAGQVQWRHLNATDGLPGTRVWDIGATVDAWWIATSGGVLRLRRDTGALGRSGEWSRFDKYNGLPANDVRSIATTPSGTVYAGTVRGMAVSFDGGMWQAVAGPLGVITALAVDMSDPEMIYVGTEEGLYRLRLFGTHVEEMIQLVSGVAVSGIAANPESSFHEFQAWVATDQGLFAVRNDGVVLLPQTSKEAIDAVTVWQGEVWYAQGQRIYSVDHGEELDLDGPVGALAGSPSADMWIGGRGRDGELLVWCVEDGLGITTFTQQESGITAFDPTRFVDPAHEVVAQGLAGDVKLSTQLGPVQLKGGYQWQEAGFTPLGRSDYTEMAGWDVEGIMPLKSGEVVFSHRDYLQRRYLGLWPEEPQKIRAHELSLRWNRGVAARASYAIVDECTIQGELEQRRSIYRTDLSGVSQGIPFSLSFYGQQVQPGPVDPSRGPFSEIGVDGTLSISDQVKVHVIWESREPRMNRFDWSLRLNQTLGPAYCSLGLYARESQERAANDPKLRQGMMFSTTISQTITGLHQRGSLNIDLSREGPVGSNLEQYIGAGTLSLSRWAGNSNQAIELSLKGEDFPLSGKRILTDKLVVRVNSKLNEAWSSSLRLSREGHRVEHPYLGERRSVRSTLGAVLAYQSSSRWDNRAWVDYIIDVKGARPTFRRELRNKITWYPRLGQTYSLLLGQDTSDGLGLFPRMLLTGGELNLDISDLWHADLKMEWRHGLDLRNQGFDTFKIRLGLIRVF